MSTSVLEQIDQIKDDATKGVELGTRALHILEIFAQRQISLEQSSASLGKLLSAICKTLIAKGVTTDSEIMDALTDVEVENDKKEVSVLVNAGVVTASTTVTPTSFVVASVNRVDGTKGVPYRLFKLADMASTVPDFVADIQGRVVGDTLPLKLEDGTQLTVQVLEIYELSEAKAA